MSLLLIINKLQGIMFPRMLFWLVHRAVKQMAAQQIPAVVLIMFLNVITVSLSFTG